MGITCPFSSPGVSVSLFLHYSPQALTFWVPLLPSKVKQLLAASAAKTDSFKQIICQ